jgi:hypothetical protein
VESFKPLALLLREYIYWLPPYLRQPALSPDAQSLRGTQLRFDMPRRLDRSFSEDGAYGVPAKRKGEKFHLSLSLHPLPYFLEPLL